MDCEAYEDPDALRKLLEKHTVKNHFTPDPEFATSPICIKEDDFDFFVDLSLISNVESDPFCGTENDDAIEHMNKLASLSLLFSDDKKIQRYYLVKLFPFSLKVMLKCGIMVCLMVLLKVLMNYLMSSLQNIFSLTCSMRLCKEFLISDNWRMSISLKLGGDLAHCSALGQGMI